MAFLHSGKGAGKKTRIRLLEDFRKPEREPAAYSSLLDGFQLTGDALRGLVKEFGRRDAPLLQLYLMGYGGVEELRDVKVRKVGRRVLRLVDLDPDGKATSFVRRHSRVRFGFEHRGQSYFFETRVVGSTDIGGTVLVAERPEVIYQERREYPRYHVWPEFHAFLGWMQVLDISWNGLRILSETSLHIGEVLEFALLSLPRVYAPERGECLFPGARIQIPSAVVSFRLRKKGHFLFGLNFSREWSEEGAEKLREFLQAIDMCDASVSNCGKSLCSENGQDTHL